MQTKILIGKVFGILKGINFRQLRSLIARFKFSVTIVPEGTSLIKAKSYSFWRICLFLYLFGTVCAFITGALMVYTPVNRLFFDQSYQLSHYQVKELKKLDDQIKSMVKEVERLQESNKNLRNAILLGDSTALNPFIQSAPKAKISKTPKEGNVFALPLGYLWNTTLGFLQKIFAQAEVAGMEFRRPCDGFISNRYKPSEGHYGIDYSLTTGSPVFAVSNGYVVFADYTADDGHMVILNHGDGYVSIYKHCQQPLKRARQKVMQGEMIALSGATGRLAGGPHLHFELWKDGRCLDPEKLIIE